MTLDRLKVGAEGVIVHIGGEAALQCRLMDFGLIPNTPVVVAKAAPLGDPLEVRLRGYSLTLRLADARHIEVIAR